MKEVSLTVWCRYFNKLQAEMDRIKHKHPDIFGKRGHGFKGLKFQDAWAENKYYKYQAKSEVAQMMIERIKSKEANFQSFCKSMDDDIDLALGSSCSEANFKAFCKSMEEDSE